MRVLLVFLMLAGVAYGEQITHPYEDFVNGTAATADEVDANFDASEVGIDDNALDIDALEAGTTITAAITRDTEWDTAAEMNAATTDTDMVLDTDIGGTVQAYDADLDDLADGTLSESKIDAAITRDSEVGNISHGTITPVHDCTTGEDVYMETDVADWWLCTATNTWTNSTP